MYTPPDLHALTLPSSDGRRVRRYVLHYVSGDLVCEASYDGGILAVSEVGPWGTFTVRWSREDLSQLAVIDEEGHEGTLHLSDGTVLPWNRGGHSVSVGDAEARRGGRAIELDRRLWTALLADVELLLGGLGPLASTAFPRRSPREPDAERAASPMDGGLDLPGPGFALNDPGRL